MTTKKELLISSLQSDIINRVKAIEAQKEEKRRVALAFTKMITQLESEKQDFLEDLEELKRQELTLEADKILESE